MSRGPPAVLARGVGHEYPSGRRGLEPIDLCVEPGEVVAVLGPNGSGKSTLLRLLATDLRPTAGSLALLGRPVRGNLVPIRRQIGYAPDTPVHFDVLTGRENARVFHTMVPPPGGARAADGAGLDQVAELFRAFDLLEASDLAVAQYSYGMRRKLLLVQSLCFAPRLVLLDEPSIGLDPRAMSALRDAVHSRQAAGGTVIIASNEIREVPMWVDRVLFLHRGRLVEDAPLSSLLSRLEGRTRIRIELSGPGPGRWPGGLMAIPGVETVRRTQGGVWVESSLGGGPLPALLKALLRAECQVSDVSVRSPDLGDLFQALTGERLAPIDGKGPGAEGEEG